MEETVKLDKPNEERRLAIAQALHLDVGVPNEPRPLPNGELVSGRDDIGLSKDPKSYADNACSNCSGRGIVIRRVHVPLEAVLKLVAQNPANEAMFDVDVKKKKGKDDVKRFFRRETRMCGCAIKSYQRVRDKYGRALAEAGLVEVSVAADSIHYKVKAG